MVALVAADVTLTIENETIQTKLKRNRVKIVFGDAAKTYPAGGVPLPTFGSWGMRRNLDYIILTDASDADGTLWKYDQDNNKLRGYRQNIRMGSTAAADSALGSKVEDSQGAETLFRAMDALVDTDLDIGKLAEFGTAHAPPAQVLYAEAVGW